MITRRYYAASGAKGVACFSVTGPNDQYNYIITLHRKTKGPWDLGIVTTGDLLTGRDFQLQNNSILRVQLNGAQPLVSLNGQLLPQIPAPAAELVNKTTLTRARTAIGVLGAIGILTLIGLLLLPLLTLLNKEIPSVALISGTISFILGILYIFLWFFATRYSLTALITASVLYIFDTLLLFFPLVSGSPQSMNISGMVVHILFLILLLRGIGPVKQIRNAVAEEKARFNSAVSLSI